MPASDPEQMELDRLKETYRLGTEALKRVEAKITSEAMDLTETYQMLQHISELLGPGDDE
jgi:hypothetical protein